MVLRNDSGLAFTRTKTKKNIAMTNIADFTLKHTLGPKPNR